MPLLSIAIPTYNRKEYLGDCLKSLLQQSFSGYCIYVFDNASEYDIESFLKEFRSNKIFLIRNGKNIGNPANFEKIFSHTFDSSYIMVFHDDDVLHPDYLENAVSVLEKDKELIWVGSGLKFTKDNKKMFDFSKVGKVNLDILDKTGLIKTILKDFDLCFGSVVYRNSFSFNSKELFEKFGKWMDRPLLVELSQKGKVGLFKYPFVNYRIHIGQDSQAISSSDLLEKLKNLYFYYRDNLSQRSEDKKAFLIWSTNFLLLDMSGFAKNLPDYFRLLKNCKKEGLIDYSYLRPRGFYYFLKSIKRIVFDRII